MSERGVTLSGGGLVLGVRGAGFSVGVALGVGGLALGVGGLA